MSRDLDLSAHQVVSCYKFERYVDQHPFKHKRAAPSVAVTCRCGAKWQGRYAIRNEVVGHHLHRKGCGVTYWIPKEETTLEVHP